LSIALHQTQRNFVKLFTALPVIKDRVKTAATDGGEDGDPDSHDQSAAAADIDVNRHDVADLRRDFDALMRRYQQPIFNLVMQLVGDEDEAGDVTLDTFLSAYRARDSFRGDSKVFTWLYRIAINHSKNRRKSKARARVHEGPSLDAGYESADGGGEEGSSLLESSLVADWSLAPETILEKGELRDKIRDAIDVLPDEYRSVLILREMEDMNYNDIAEATGLTLEAVKTRIARARGMVRRRVAPYYSQD
jgi:RNA polymerase sigma-70 factor (ECF subfamily)